ncbi:MAG: hypothetical protein G01um101425_20 [Candidatus Peregrinibacteria bacterium Gr01-1014_25]|nr:MAG: hypothetical protein G01um101425_20 [Candidatus Peregrinibacteria bacterium Gr01-1014_25]
MVHRGLLAIALGLSCAASAFDAHAQTAIDVVLAPPLYQRSAALRDAVHRDALTPLTSATAIVRGDAPMSHVRVRYSAPAGMVLLLAPGTYDPLFLPDALLAALPPGVPGEVIIPVMHVPGWHGGIRAIGIAAFSPADAPGALIAVSGVDQAPYHERWLAELGHVLRTEKFPAASINFLLGYRMGALPLPVLLLGIGLVIAALRRRMGWPRAIALSAFVALGMYTVRFDVDLIRTFAADARAWHAAGTYGEMGDLYSIADAFRGEAKAVPNARIAACGQTLAPVRYLVHPLPTASWMEATHAALLRGWQQEGDNYICNSDHRRGAVVQTFPGGGQLIRFTDAHP